MGRPSEARVAKQVPILVHGTDPSGTPFRIPAKTVDISGSSASLTGLNGVGLTGTKIEIEDQGRRAGFRTQWAGKDGTKLASQAGVRSPRAFSEGRPQPERGCSRPPEAVDCQVLNPAPPPLRTTQIQNTSRPSCLAFPVQSGRIPISGAREEHSSEDNLK
jgi:hypothetical protein